MTNKVLTSSSLTQEVQDLRKRRKKIVATCGAFDILHVGHLTLLEEAKKNGDILIVCLNSDKSIRQYKSPLRPINNQEDRAKMLAALEVVDYVALFDEADPRNLLEKIKPDIFAKSHSGYKGIEGEVVERSGGKVLLLNDVPGKSTTALMEKIRELPSVL